MPTTPIPTRGGSGLAAAAALLEAVARACEDALDAEVPLRCGRAADLLHAATGTAATALPLPDRAVELTAALDNALALLAALPPGVITDRVLDAVSETRAAASAARASVGR